MSQMKEADITVADRDPHEMKMNIEGQDAADCIDNNSCCYCTEEFASAEIRDKHKVQCHMGPQLFVCSTGINRETTCHNSSNQTEKDHIVKDWKNGLEMPEIKVELEEEVDCEEFKVSVEELMMIKQENCDLQDANEEMIVNRTERGHIIGDWKTAFEMQDTKIKLEENVDCEEVKIGIEEVMIKDEYAGLNDSNEEIVMNRNNPDQSSLWRGPKDVDEKPKRLTSNIDCECEKPHYYCDQCEYKSHFKRSLKRHTLLKHENVEETFKKFKCELCPYKSDLRNNFNRHKLSHDVEGIHKKYQCDQCDYKTHFKDTLRNHQLVHDAEGIHKKFECSQCDYKTRSKPHLKRHQLSHDVDKKYKCKLCEYKTNFESDLKRHQSIHDVDGVLKKYKCEHCEYKTHSKALLKNHQVRHDVEGIYKKYKCDQCDYVSSTKPGLKHHTFIHDVEGTCKKYKCDQCDYKTHLHSRLKHHKRRHGAVEQVRTDKEKTVNDKN
ncbi:unnamed protein product [Callosobruchus maculatus]|uniref:C2H2-type domain-containing protein n=1 Tax=Callosobruchus maculatus TaxID=64391 RepID=A0A653DBH7_CALMS|nr:unnamed protein product [Callosobruchus maculatus]